MQRQIVLRSINLIFIGIYSSLVSIFLHLLVIQVNLQQRDDKRKTTLQYLLTVMTLNSMKWAQKIERWWDSLVWAADAFGSSCQSLDVNFVLGLLVISLAVCTLVKTKVTDSKSVE